MLKDPNLQRNTFLPVFIILLCTALADLKEAIREADLIELGPHELVKHCSSIVLLSGTIYTAGRASSIPPVANSSSQSSPAVSGRLSGEDHINTVLSIPDVAHGPILISQAALFYDMVPKVLQHCKRMLC